MFALDVSVEKLNLFVPVPIKSPLFLSNTTILLNQLKLPLKNIQHFLFCIDLIFALSCTCDLYSIAIFPVGPQSISSFSGIITK